MAADVAPRADEAVLEDAAAQVTVQLVLDDWSQPFSAVARVRGGHFVGSSSGPSWRSCHVWNAIRRRASRRLSAVKPIIMSGRITVANDMNVSVGTASP